MLLEAEPALTHDLRAGSFHPPTLDMMAPYGITARMQETGIQVRHWQIRDKPGDLIAEFDLDLLAADTPYPYRLHLEQHRLTPDSARYPAPATAVPKSISAIRSPASRRMPAASR